ncbi:MAG: DUF2760 domain-containing protein [Bryobacteraceae bacterium]
MGRLILAIRSFFAILLRGSLPDDLVKALGFSHRGAKTPAAPPPAPAASATAIDGALQILGILQRDSRLIDFLMEDISGYSDDQVGAAVRAMHQQSRDALNRYVKLAPVIDGVEGTFTKLASVEMASVKLVGNVPPQPPAGGTLRHRGWKCVKADLPPLGARAATAIVAPAEIEIE